MRGVGGLGGRHPVAVAAAAAGMLLLLLALARGSVAPSPQHPYQQRGSGDGSTGGGASSSIRRRRKSHNGDGSAVVSQPPLPFAPDDAPLAAVVNRSSSPWRPLGHGRAPDAVFNPQTEASKRDILADAVAGGATWAAKSSLVGLSEARVPPGVTVALHAHPNKVEWFLVTGGEGSLDVEGADGAVTTTVPLSEGVSAAVRPTARHRLSCSPLAARDLTFFVLGVAV